jgi:hypothetical protein
MSGQQKALQAAIANWAFMGLLGIPILVFLDPLHGWRWEPHNEIYDQMIVSIYIAIGVFSILSIKDPLKNASFLWFVVWSSVAHGCVMLFHALHSQIHRGHLLGDVWILLGALGLAIPLWVAQHSDDQSE